MGLQLLDGDVCDLFGLRCFAQKNPMFRIHPAFCMLKLLVFVKAGTDFKLSIQKRGVLKMGGFNTQNGRRG